MYVYLFINKILEILPRGVSKKLLQLLRKVYFYFKYEKIVSFYSLFFSQEDLVFDVGANRGYLTKFFNEIGAQVIAIEPHPKIYQKLNFKFKKEDDVLVLNKGVAEKSKSIPFYICKKRPSISTFSKEYTNNIFSSYNWKKTNEVDITTLDKLIGQFGKPEFIKIDVEGLELKVIKGLNFPISSLSFEFRIKEQKKLLACLRELTNISDKYRFNFVLGEGYTFYLDKFVNKEELLDNILAINSEKIFGDIYAKIDKNNL